MIESSSSFRTPALINDGPLVSVIMPCYNVEPFVKQALESIIHQTYRNLEILLIDDGSTDETYSIISPMAIEDNRIRLVRHAKNMGIVATLNEGIVQCKGEYITYMHADDISSVHRIKTLMNFIFQEPKPDLVAASYCLLDENERISAPIIPKSTLPKSIKFTVFLVTPMPHPLVLGKTIIFKDFLYNPNYEYSEDYDLFSRAALSNLIIKNLDLSLYYIRLSNMRLSYRFAAVQNHNHIRISRRNIQQYFGLTFDPAIHQIAVNRMEGNSTIAQVKEAFQLIDLLKNKFLEKEPCSEPEKLEIDKVLREQKIDILIQCSKYLSIRNFLGYTSFVPAFIVLLIHRHSLRYLMQKIQWKIRTFWI